MNRYGPFRRGFLFETFYPPPPLPPSIILSMSSPPTHTHTPEATRFIVIERRVKQMPRRPIFFFFNFYRFSSRISCRRPGKYFRWPTGWSLTDALEEQKIDRVRHIWNCLRQQNGVNHQTPTMIGGQSRPANAQCHHQDPHHHHHRPSRRILDTAADRRLNDDSQWESQCGSTQHLAAFSISSEKPARRTGCCVVEGGGWCWTVGEVRRGAMHLIG